MNVDFKTTKDQWGKNKDNSYGSHSPQDPLHIYILVPHSEPSCSNREVLAAILCDVSKLHALPFLLQEAVSPTLSLLTLGHRAMQLCILIPSLARVQSPKVQPGPSTWTPTPGGGRLDTGAQTVLALAKGHGILESHRHGFNPLSASYWLYELGHL